MDSVHRLRALCLVCVWQKIFKKQDVNKVTAYKLLLMSMWQTFICRFQILTDNLITSHPELDLHSDQRKQYHTCLVTLLCWLFPPNR